MRSWLFVGDICSRCAFHGDFAIVGISQPRHNKTFSGLPLDEKIATEKRRTSLRATGD
nr:hypothetical protein [Nostoc sp. EkiNYC01]